MKFSLSILIFLVLFCCTCRRVTDSHSLESAFALVNCTLIDGTGADPVANAVIVVENDIITAVGMGAKICLPAQIQQLDLAGATVLPGLINAHVHHGYDEDNLSAWARAGVTTVRDLGGNMQNDLFSFRNRVNKNPQFARLVAAGPMVTVPDGYPTIPFGGSSALAVTSTAEARQKITGLLDQGADLIKIALESGVIFGRNIAMLAPETVAAIVQVAHQRETVVSVHVTVSRDLARALDAGVDDIAHMVVDDLPDSLVRRLVAADVCWVPTLELWHGTGYGDIAKRNLRKFVQAGGTVALGTDYAGYTCPFDLGLPIRELKWMLAAGMTPMQVIVAVTKNAARVCNRSDRIGTLEIGKNADILVVNGDPLADVNALLQVRMVIHGGEIIRDEKK